MLRFRRQLEAGVEELAEAFDDGQADALARLLIARTRVRLRRESDSGRDVAAAIGARIPRVDGDFRGVAQLLRERRAVVFVDAGAGVLNGEGPAVGVASAVEVPR